MFKNHCNVVNVNSDFRNCKTIDSNFICLQKVLSFLTPNNDLTNIANLYHKNWTRTNMGTKNVIAYLFWFEVVNLDHKKN